MKHKQCKHNREIRVKSDFGDSECHAHPPGPTSRNEIFAYPIIRSEDEACGEFEPTVVEVPYRSMGRVALVEMAKDYGLVITDDIIDNETIVEAIMHDPCSSYPKKGT